MAISSAVQKGSSVYVYDEKNKHIFTQSGELVGFTGNTVSVKKGSSVYVYDEKGHHTATH
ncbi:hypothetical protein [Helicobacter bizzozeronii]|uniref:hypothetical protein n=1 Tax=Helicobacter bizzozeronii TaxID=56877 RepID=UPI000CF188A4|nr:hypothetical protein [Helicobacter bizzozeronii]